MSFTPAAPLSLQDINPLSIETKYAVRGRVPTRAEELKKQLEKDPHSLPFDKIINSNIGNPQQLDQKPLTFYRRGLSLIQNPELLESPPATYPKDVIARAKRFLTDAKSAGAYSNSQGVSVVRESVANFIGRRDGFKAHTSDIFLTNGASAAVEYVIETLCFGPKSGVLIPIPQYPLYTAILALLNVTAVPYYLQEDKGWSIDAKEIEHQILEQQKQGVKTKILVLINPGNPTGAVLTAQTIAEILEIAAKYGVVIIADEVYQENVYKGEFVSVRKVLKTLQQKHSKMYDNVQLASLHSTSKGLNGECGQRGGYMELIGFTDEVKKIFVKMVSINLCSVVSGQCVVEMMTNPPKEGDDSYALDQQERKFIYDQLKHRSQYLADAFNHMDGVECQDADGAMYLFPKFNFPQKVIDLAKAKELEPDAFYCLELLEKTGICTVPGSGFRQVKGTYHVRTTFLPPGIDWINSWKNFHNSFISEHKD